MDAVEKNIKNVDKIVRYSKNIDLRQLTDTLQVKVYATGLHFGKKFNKTLFITMDYDVSKPAQLYLIYKGKNLVDSFLYFKSEDFKTSENKFTKLPVNSDFILRLNRENSRTLSLKQVGKGKNKSLLSTKEIFSTGKEAALRSFSPPKNGKNHQIQMVLPGISVDENYTTLGFDVDIRAFSTTGPVTSIFFKLNSPNSGRAETRRYVKDKTGDIDSTILVEPKKIKTLIKAPTSYVDMTTKDLELGQVKFNYFEYFESLNQQYTDYYLKSSEVFIVKNVEDYKINLGDFLENSVKEIPYNISRKLEGNKITASSPFFDRGIKKYPLNWVEELRDNIFFTELDSCIELSFYSESHFDNFEQSLKETQIADLETYPQDTSNQISIKPKTYNNIQDWTSRTDNDFFNDLKIEYHVGTTMLKSLTICPSKRTLVNEYVEKNIKYKQNQCACKYSDDASEKLQSVIVSPINEESCGEACRKQQIKLGFEKCWTCENDYYAPIYDLRNDWFSTTFSTFKESFSAGTTYTAYTSGATTGTNTYDVYFSGTGFTATTYPTTGIAIPINNTHRIEHRPFVGVTSPSWVPFNSWQSLSAQTGTSSGSGAMIIQSGDPTNYMIYKSLSGGNYNFQYNAYLDIKYTDTKWCEYLTTNYLSGDTSSISYPSTEYELKRLINSSIIEKGLTEGETVKKDTGGVYFPGKEGLNNNTGLIEFDFDIFLEKQDKSGVTSNVVGTVIGASPLTNSSANIFLLSQTNIVQNTMSGFSNCYASGTSANTVFHHRIPISLDTGLISLEKGETMMLKYNIQFNATSKVAGGSAYVEMNLGHQLDLSGNPVASPFYRVTKYSPPSGDTATMKKKLFMNSHKVSLPQEFVSEGGIRSKQTTKGTLYVIDDEYSPILPPTINQNTFQALTFIDNKPKSNKLELDTQSNKPTNNWARQIEANQLSDYYLPNGVDLLDIKSGIMIFNLPRYDQKDSVYCNYKFPQIRHSYVIKNTISNVRGADKEHFIVITPTETIYVPCFTPTLDDKFELIESEIKIKEQIDNVDNQIIIDGSPIILKPVRSAPLTQFKADEGFKCKFYCVCEDMNHTKNLHPFYGTTDIITDTAIMGCEDCEEKAETYCGELGRTCRHKVFTNSCIGDKSNLYTSGDEYLLPTGDVYIGFYHIYNQVPMVGAIHTNDPHDSLTPINEGQIDRINKINNINYNNISYNNLGNGY
tara:strand:+ start:4697 stop:8320 length:3624 start_codon:yes stop_codon:yes gene_type:complete